MATFIDYECVDQEVALGKKAMLRVVLKTKEFGNIISRLVEKRGEDSKIDIWNMLADEVIAEYNRRLQK